MSTGSGEAAAQQEAREDAEEGLVEREAETVSEFDIEDIAEVQELDEVYMPSAKKTKFAHPISDGNSEATPRRLL